jgi:hypothetical protein
MVWTEPLYGDVTIEVADNTAVAPTWVNLSADLLNATASRGTQAAIAGESETAVGMMTAMFNNLATDVGIGWWVRVRITGTNIWSGYVSEKSVATVFDENEPGRSYEVTTLVASDWVGVAANTTVDGSVIYPMTTVYDVNMTIAEAVDKLNDAVASSYNLISYDAGFSSTDVGQSDENVTIAEHLDILCATDITNSSVWYSSASSPTTNHAPAGGIVLDYYDGTSLGDFSDSDASALHYTDIVAQSSSTAVSNIITADNRSMIRASNNPKLRVFVDEQVTATDATSVGTYGERLATIVTRAPMDFNFHNLKRDINLCYNPTVEYDTNGYLVDSSAATTIRRFKPSLEATPFDAYDGDYALRRTFLTAGPNTNILYNHDGAEGIPVIAGYGYKFLVRGARYTTATDAQLRADIIWYDDNGAVISTITGTPVTMTNIRQWYAASHSGTAPATAVTAKLRVTFLRSGGTNFAVGAKLYADAFCFFEVTSLTDTMTYFSGDTEDTTGFIYSWFGQPGWSESARFVNSIYTGVDYLAGAYGTTYHRASELRWNAADDFATAKSLDLFKSVRVQNASLNGGAYDVLTICGIQWEINPETIMCTIQLT